MRPEVDLKYSPGFERLLNYAAYDCALRGRTALAVDHLTLGLFRVDFPLIDDLLASFNVDSLVVLDRHLRAHPEAREPATPEDVHLSPEALQVIDLAEREAHGLGHSVVTPSHTLLGVLMYNRDSLERFFIREKIFKRREDEVLARVRAIVSWLRPGTEGLWDRELGMPDSDTIFGVESRPLRGKQKGGDSPSGLSGYAVHLRMFKRLRAK